MTLPPGTEGLRHETALAAEAVQQGLEAAQRTLGTARTTLKGGRDLVTEADLAVEDTIRSRLGERLGHPVVGEERGGEPPPGGAPYWLVDPICGTRNFASGTPLYCVNLALVEGGEVTVSAVGDASRQQVLVAERGKGAWVFDAGARSRLRSDDESRVIMIEDGKSTGLRREHAARFMSAAIAADRWDMRSLGSTLSLA